MDLHRRYRLTRVINARGTFTPLGVSRSTPAVAAAVAGALPEFFVIDELQDRAGAAIAEVTGAEAGAVVHCTAAGITVAVAATIAGTDAERIAALPDTSGLPDRVVVPSIHAVDYGQSNLQAVRLAGARVVLAGDDDRCDLAELDAALAGPGVACLMLVASRLVHGEPLDLAAAVRIARRYGVPVVVDGAGQFARARELVATGAGLVLFSGQKYLASPTAGLVAGSARLVAAVRAQGNGIGRGSKPTKEALVGVLAAIDAWRTRDHQAWAAEQAAKVTGFVQAAAQIPGVAAEVLPDPSFLPLVRAGLTVADGPALARDLAAGTPSIQVMQDGEQLVLELVPLDAAEMAVVLERIRVLLDA